jgi:Protein of unknown function (DUF3551)
LNLRSPQSHADEAGGSGDRHEESRKEKKIEDMTRIWMIGTALAASILLGGWTFGFDRQGPFCLYDRDYTNCGFPSFAACLATASGAGGYCAQNPRFAGERAPPPRPRRGRNYAPY